MQHSKLPPSSAARRYICPGSRALEEQYPRLTESESAAEGTAAHWVAAEYLMYGCSAVVTPEGEPITEEMREGATLYADTIREIWDGCSTLHIEERVDIHNIHPDCFGTPDCWFVRDDVLHVFDYKFGHRYVDVFGNWQLLEYAAGVSELVEFKTVMMTIVQPRSYTREGPVRSWTITRAELDKYILRLRKAEEESMRPNTHCVPSPECAFCSARTVCGALSETVGTFITILNQNHAHELNPKQTARELKQLRFSAELLNARITGLEEQARHMITRGDSVPGFKLESVSSREQWTRETAEIITLGELMSVNLCKPPEPITPAQARKVGLHEEILRQYSKRVPGKLKLVEEKNAERIFVDLKGNN